MGLTPNMLSDGVVEMRPRISRKSELSMNMLEGLKGWLRADTLDGGLEE